MESDERKRGGRKFFLAPVIGLHKLSARILKKTLSEEYGDAAEDVIMSMVDAGSESGELDNTSAEIIGNVFEFDDLAVSDVMTHRVNIVGVDINAGLDEIVYIALEKGFSRIPVYKDGIDDIMGLIIVKDLLCLVGKSDLSGYKTGDFLREAVFVPESCSCTKTFRELTTKKAGMAVVVDEYGGTAGIVTMEDLIEEVMGNIQDEYDEEGAQIKLLGKDKYDVNGEADPEDVLELFGYELPDDHEYDTIAGFVTDLLGYIPEDGENPPHVDYKDLRFVVKGVEGNCISRLIVFKT